MRIDRSILPPGRIGLAVSGGSDSVALAWLLTRGGRAANRSRRFVVLHVNHGLRSESVAEYTFTENLARRLGVPFMGVHAQVERQSGESLEMACRRVRLDFFARCMRELNLDAIATGHTMDDVAETFLLRVARAAGPEGLAGPKATSSVGNIRFVRPLLGCRDSELQSYLCKYGETWCEDASNGDTSIRRNFVRHKLLPYLKDNFDPKIVEHLARSAQLCAATVRRS